MTAWLLVSAVRRTACLKYFGRTRQSSGRSDDNKGVHGLRSDQGEPASSDVKDTETLLRDAARRELVEGLARVAAGDLSSLSEVYRRTSHKLFGICLRILRDEAEAEEVLQDVYVAVWRNSARFDPNTASPITWLATIARNRAIDRLRSAGSRNRHPSEPIETGGDPSHSVTAAASLSEQRTELADCLGLLEQSQAEAIRAAFFEGLTYSELAARSRVPVATMRSRMRRSLLKLRDCLTG